MALNVLATANAVADYWASLGASFSLHTGNPGAAGTANEAAGGGYARQTTTWGAASGGTVTGSKITFDVVAGTYTHLCRWNGSTLRDIIDNPDVTINPAGKVEVTPSCPATYAAWT